MQQQVAPQHPPQQIGMHKRVPTNDNGGFPSYGKPERSPVMFPQQRNVSMPPVFLSSQPSLDLSQQGSSSLRSSSPYLRPNSASSGAETRSASPSKMAFDPFAMHAPPFSKDNIASTASISTTQEGMDRLLSISPASSNDTYSTSHSISNNVTSSNSIIPPIGTRPDSANSQDSGSLVVNKTNFKSHTPTAFSANDFDDYGMDDPLDLSSSAGSNLGAIGAPQSKTPGSSIHSNALSWSKVWGPTVGDASSSVPGKNVSRMATASVWG